MQIFWTDLLNGEHYALLSACIAYVVLMGIISITHYFRIRRWPHTVGTLTEDGVASFGSYSDRMFAARVRYDYFVDGATYTGGRLSPFLILATGTRMAEWQKGGIQRHGGDRITVFYNPARPNKSYLILPTAVGMTGISLLFVIVAPVLWLAF